MLNIYPRYSPDLDYFLFAIAQDATVVLDDYITLLGMREELGATHLEKLKKNRKTPRKEVCCVLGHLGNGM